MLYFLSKHDRCNLYSEFFLVLRSLFLLVIRYRSERWINIPFCGLCFFLFLLFSVVMLRSILVLHATSLKEWVILGWGYYEGVVMVLLSKKTDQGTV